MIGESFQLAGAILTVYAIISLSDKAVQDSGVLRAPLSGQKVEKLKDKYEERSYAYAGIFLIIVGYIFPILEIDIPAIQNKLNRLILFITIVVFLAFAGVQLSKRIAKLYYDKIEPFYMGKK